MPQEVVPSLCFLRKGHLNRISQHAPQRLHSPRRNASCATTSSLRKLTLTKRRSLPCACRARNLTSSTARERFAATRRSSNDCFRRGRPCRLGFIKVVFSYSCQQKS